MTVGVIHLDEDGVLTSTVYEQIKSVACMDGGQLVLTTIHNDKAKLKPGQWVSFGIESR